MRYLITYLSLTKNVPLQASIEAASSGQAVLAAMEEIEDCGPIVGTKPIKLKETGE